MLLVYYDAFNFCNVLNQFSYYVCHFTFVVE